MSSSRAWVVYSVLRIGLFVGVFAVLALLGVDPFLSALIAAVLGLCVTYIFFRRQRDDVVTSFARWRSSGASAKDADGDAEDAALDDVDNVAPNRADAPAGDTDPDRQRFEGDPR